MMENADDKFVLRDFIQNRMRMSHIYQPVMIKALLENDGQATTEEIAKALLAYDQSQVEYYSLRTKTMVGKVLTNNGVVEPVKDGRQITGYHLTETTHTEAQRTALQAMCDEAINSYISKRGEAIWGHRGSDSSYVSAAPVTTYLNVQNIVVSYAEDMRIRSPSMWIISFQGPKVALTTSATTKPFA
jgi:ATP adenylyltransferase